MSFLTILGSIIAPIFVLIGVGVGADRLFTLDLRTLSKLNFYVFVPALLFIKILDAGLDGGVLAKVVMFTLIHMGIMFALARGMARHRALWASRDVFSLGAVFSNAGNYGIPLCIVAFGEEYVGALGLYIVTQNVLSFTFGVWLFQKEDDGVLDVLRALAKVPVIHAVVLAFVMRWLDLDLLEALHRPLDLLADGLVPVALLTLGAQLSRSVVSVKNVAPLSVLAVLRLGVAPALAFALAPLFGFPPPISSLLIVASGLPVAVNVYILAAEYKQDEALASQAIFWTTLLSAATVSVLLAIVL